MLRLRALRRRGQLRAFESIFFAASLLLLSAAGMGSLTACGSSGPLYETPPGTSTVTVTATSGSITQMAGITVVIQ